MDSQIYRSRRRSSVIIDHRFEGRSLEIYTVDGDKLAGLVDEVSLYEIGIDVGEPIIVQRSAILYVIAGFTDIYGASECCEKDYILDESFIGSEVELRLINGQNVSGKLVKITRDEIGVVQNVKTFIIPRGSISYIKIIGR